MPRRARARPGQDVERCLSLEIVTEGMQDARHSHSIIWNVLLFVICNLISEYFDSNIVQARYNKTNKSTYYIGHF